MDHFSLCNHKNITERLSEMKHQVLLESTHSNHADVLSGVLQGTVLGPLLFLACINDLQDSLRSSGARLFADGSLFYLTVDGTKNNSLLQEDLTATEEWERLWQMRFNPKCESRYGRERRSSTLLIG